MASPSRQVDRRCPWCGSSDTEMVHRGYAGIRDEVDQYFTCRYCGKVTFELVSKNAREMRLGRYHAGSIYKDPQYNTRYSVTRVLKVGVNEFLVYLKPITGTDTLPAK